MSEDTRSPEDGPGISDAAPVRWTPYPFNSGQPQQDTDHIFEIPSLLFGGKPPSFPAIKNQLKIIPEASRREIRNVVGLRKRSGSASWNFWSIFGAILGPAGR